MHAIQQTKAEKDLLYIYTWRQHATWEARCMHAAPNGAARHQLCLPGARSSAPAATAVAAVAVAVVVVAAAAVASAAVLLGALGRVHAGVFVTHASRIGLKERGLL